MESPRLYRQPAALKLTVTCFLLLASLGFLIAALMSHEHYGFSHERTVVYFLGDEKGGGIEMPKLYSQLIQTAHVHSFTMPLVFLALWLGLHFTPLNTGWKSLFILGGALSILLYNMAPFLVRYESPKFVGLFSVGGIGLFLFFLIPASLILYETWFGLGNRARR